MLIHVTTFSAANVGAVIKEVTCEKCAARFVYEMIRRGTGSGTAIYGIGSDSQTAANEAAEALNRFLVDGEDLVACPQCGWFQESMIAKNATRYWYWSPWGVGNRLNPNTTMPTKRGHFPGTPTAVLLDAHNNTVPTMFQRPPDIEPDNVLSIRMFQNEFPPICICCGQPATTTVDLEPQAGINPAISVPACSSCAEAKAKRLRRLKMKLFAMFFSLPLVGLLTLGIMTFVSEENDGGTLLSMTFMLLLAALICGVLAHFFGNSSKDKHMPLKIVRMDWETLICRVRFDDLQCLARVRDHIGTLPLSKNILEYIAASQPC